MTRSNKFFSKNSTNIIAFILFVTALAARLLFLFKFTDPDYAGAGPHDTSYSHWIIAYLSKEVGFKEGFLKLSDISGMGYFYGLLHPLIMITAFFLTGSMNLAVERATTAFFGSLTVVLIFLICKKTWNSNISVFAGLITALNPIIIFNDSSGAVEPLGIFFLLFAVYCWPKKPVIAGLSISLAFMARAENWIITPLMVGSMVLFTPKVKRNVKIKMLISYCISVSIYIIYIYVNTGNPIYPLYINFIANLLRGGMQDTFASTQALIGRLIFIGLLLISISSSVLLILKKPKGYLLFLLGSIYLLFLGVSFGLSNYAQSISPDIWIGRFLLLPIIVLGVFLSNTIFSLNARLRNFFLIPGKLQAWILSVLILLLSSLLWIPIAQFYIKYKSSWQESVSYAKNIYPYYHGGGVVALESSYSPNFYALYRYAKIPGENIVSEGSDPFFTMYNDPYLNWQEYKSLFKKWIKTKDIRMIVTKKIYSSRYIQLSAEMPAFISDPIYIPNSNLVVFQLNN